MGDLPIIYQGPMVRAILGKLKTQTRRTVRHFNSTVDGGPANRALWAKLDFENAWVDPSCLGGAPCLKVPCPESGTVHRVRCKYEPGDRLWVKETMVAKQVDAPPPLESLSGKFAFYKADGKQVLLGGPGIEDGVAWKWQRDTQSSIHMPPWASRITLEVVNVRVERVQEISEEDADAEGAHADAGHVPDGSYASSREAFAALWDSINAVPKPQGATHYVSYPWGEESRDTRKEINGRPHYCHPNPWVWPITFKVLEACGA